jgi:large subunit ribosomal protein L3
VLGLIGKKVGMTQVFDEAEQLIPLTVVEAGPCPVVQVKTGDSDGYSALKVAYGDVKEQRLTKPQKGIFEKSGVKAHAKILEFRVDGGAEQGVGDVLNVSLFEAGEVVDISGRSKGKGFAGTVKRHNFAGGPKTHGQSDRHRAPGSIGQASQPSKVMKGIRMSGHMGDRNVTIRGLTVYGIDVDRNLLLIKGAVPGGRGSTVIIRKRK